MIVVNHPEPLVVPFDHALVHNTRTQDRAIMRSMVKVKKISMLPLVGLLGLALAVLGCSNNADSPGPLDSGFDVGEATVSVTGTVSDEHSGAAFYINPPHAFTIQLGGHDDDDFDVDISMVDLDGGVSIPAPGTYSIGNLASDDFRGDYVNRRLGGRFNGDHHYVSDLSAGAGVLVLEKVTDSEIAGSFEFTASRGMDANGSLIDPITVGGEFRAVPDE